MIKKPMVYLITKMKYSLKILVNLKAPESQIKRDFQENISRNEGKSLLTSNIYKAYIQNKSQLTDLYELYIINKSRLLQSNSRQESFFLIT